MHACKHGIYIYIYKSLVSIGIDEDHTSIHSWHDIGQTFVGRRDPSPCTCLEYSIPTYMYYLVCKYVYM